jgi:hypothetical protein
MPPVNLRLKNYYQRIVIEPKVDQIFAGIQQTLRQSCQLVEAQRSEKEEIRFVELEVEEGLKRLPNPFFYLFCICKQSKKCCNWITLIEHDTVEWASSL